GSSAELAAAYSYVAPISVTSISPTAVDLTGGTVHVTGSGWTRGIAIRVAGVVEGVSNYTSTGFDVYVPAGLTATLDLELDEPGVAPLILHNAIGRHDLKPPQIVSWAP